MKSMLDFSFDRVAAMTSCRTLTACGANSTPERRPRSWPDSDYDSICVECNGEFIDAASVTIIDIPTSDSAFEIVHLVFPRRNERTNRCACPDSADRAIWHELIQGHRAQSSATHDSQP
jgi:hypothetical protein